MASYEGLWDGHHDGGKLMTEPSTFGEQSILNWGPIDNLAFAYLLKLHR